MINRVVFLLFALCGFCGGCSTDRESVIENEELNVNEHQEVFNELRSFDVENDSITGMDVKADGSIFLWMKGSYVKILIKEAELSTQTIALLNSYKEKLTLVNFTGLKKYQDFIKLTRENKLFSSGCYHIRMYKKDVDFPGKNIFKLKDGIFLYFEKCGSI